MSTNNQERINPPPNPLNPRVSELLSSWSSLPLEGQSVQTPSNLLLYPSPSPDHQVVVSDLPKAQLPGRLPQRSSRTDAPRAPLRPQPRRNPVLSPDGTAHIEARAAIMRLEQAMHERENLAPVECEWRHYFAPGIYMREITMPAGSLITGRVHKQGHLSIIYRGKVDAQTQDGVVLVEVLPGEHPYVFVSPSGLKRALVVIEETTWASTHLNPTNTHDLAELQAIMTAENFEDYEMFLLEHK